MGLKVAIPLKTNSERVKNKNLKPFYGDLSLFDVKARQLLKVFNPGDVYVSCEDIKVRPQIEAYGFNFLYRDVKLTPNSAPWSEVIKDIVNNISDTDDIMWVQVTQPLFDDFAGVLEKWKAVYADHDSLAVVKKFRHHILDEHGRPVNFNFGYWHKVSQELPAFYELTWACFCMKREMLRECYYNIGRKPYLYETEINLVDIDTDQDFELASLLYRHIMERCS